MQLLIHDNLQLEDVQERFSDCFPRLKIEFYEESPSKRLLGVDNRIDPDTYIGEIRRQHYSGIFEIKSWYTVGEVEQGFMAMFGLNVQVFHNENDTWVLTKNSRTLREQVDRIQKINALNQKRREPSV
jgi:hypothetical protein